MRPAGLYHVPKESDSSESDDDSSSEEIHDASKSLLADNMGSQTKKGKINRHNQAARPKRQRKKGRKAVFLLDSLIHDQQAYYQNNTMIHNYQNPQIMPMQYVQPQFVQPQPVRTQPPIVFERGWEGLPHLQTIKPGEPPGSFDILERGV